MRGPGKDASDPGQSMIAAARKSDVAVKNDDTLYGRVPLAPPRYQKSQLVSCAFKPLIQAGFQFGDPVDDIITVDKAVVSIIQKESSNQIEVIFRGI